jgi:hypothetical protein
MCPVCFCLLPLFLCTCLELRGISFYCPKINFQKQVLNPVTQNSIKKLGLFLCGWQCLALVTFVSPRLTCQQHCDYNSVPFLHWAAYHRAQVRPEPTWGGDERFFKKFRQSGVGEHVSCERTYKILCF